VRRSIAACFALAFALLLTPAAARADDPIFDRAFGAGPADLCSSVCRAGSSGNGAGQFSFPAGVAVSGGEVFVADQNNHRISVYDTDGTFTRAFGRNVNLSGGVNPDVCTTSSMCKAGTPGATAGQLNSPYAVAVSAGEVYVADASNNRVSVFTTSGSFVRAFGKDVNAGGVGNPDVCTASTTCRAGSQGSGPGQLSFPLGVGVSGSEVFVADASNNRVSVYSTAGTYARAFGDPGSGAGQLSFPFGLAVSGGEVYVADQNNQRIVVFAAGGSFARAFGRNVNPGGGNPDICTAVCQAGTLGGGAGQLNSPLGVAVGGGEVFVSGGNQRISVFLTDGSFARAMGKDVNPSGTGDPNICTTICQASAAGGASAQLSSPAGVAVAGGEVYVADSGNYRVGVYSTAGVFARAFGKSVWGASPFVCTTVTGCGPGAAGGASGQLNLPLGVAVTGGETYVADQTNNRISVFTSAGAFVRAFGDDVNAGITGSPDVCTALTTCRAGTSGVGAGQLGMPAGVAVSGSQVYVADQNNHRISVFGTDGTFAWAFGKGVNSGAGSPDVCTAASGCRSGSLGGAPGQLDNPVAVAVSGSEIYVSDQGNRRISVFSTAGAFLRAFGKDVNTGAGNPDVCTTSCRFGSVGDGAAQLNGPYGLTVSGGEVFVADHFNNRISVYATDGTFARAFGKAVNGSGSGNPDVCTAATTCRAGSSGGAAGQIAMPFGVAMGDGALYVSERFNARLSVFGPDGTFARAFGEGVNPLTSGNPDVCTTVTGCRAAAQGDAAGQFMEPTGLAMNGTQIYVADRLIHRVAIYRVPRTEITPTPNTLAFGARDIDDGPTAVQSSTIANTGTEPVTLAGLALTGDSAHFARLTGAAGDCAAGATLAAGTSCTVRLRFDPSTTGAKAAVLTVTSNAPAITVAVQGSGIQTSLARTPTALAFGSRDVDDGPPADQSSTVTNTGTEAVSLTSFTFSGDSTQFARLTGVAGDCSATTTLVAGASCTVRLRFDPTTTGAKAATLTIASNAGPTTIDVTGRGIQTLLTRAPAALAFGARDIDDGPAAVQSSVVTNSGSEPVTLSALTLSGDAAFARLTGAAGDCAAGATLTAGATCALRVRFDPAATGPKAATLTVTSNAAPVSVALSGSGTQLQLGANPSSLDLGARDVAAGASAVQSSTVTNTGSQAVTLSGLTLTGDSAHFTRLTGAPGDCAAGGQLLPAQACTVRFQFDPATSGAKAATLTVASNAPALTVALAGFGTHTELTRSPASLAFGIRDIDTGATAIQSSTFTNAGTEPITLSGFTFAGDAAHFARVTGAPGDCATTNPLDAGESCTLRLRFDPSSTGAKAAAITVASNAAPLSVALTGSGIQTEVSSDPPSLTFGARDIDEGAGTQRATIANTGTEPVTLTGIALAGDSVHFTRLTGDPHDCAGAMPLDVGDTCTVRIRFDPSSTGLKSAALTVSSNAPALVVGLSGTGTTTRVDADGDGVPDEEDTDDDNDLVLDADDAFPHDATESVDSDGDGTGNNADPDDDNDGTPDDRDAFPLDPTRQSATPQPPEPPAPAPVEPAARKVSRPWRLKRLGRVQVVVGRTGVVFARSGYAAVCPKDGPQCTGRVTLKLVRRSPRTKKLVRIFLTGKTKPLTILPGTERKLAFRLSDRGRTLLLRLGSLRALMRGTIAVEGQEGVARRARLRLTAPR
jgi:DNA-binding beta-propeller fold protein YncE